MEQTPLFFIFLLLLLNSFPTHSQKPPIAPTQPPSSSPKPPSSSSPSPSSSSPSPTSSKPSSPSPSSSKPSSSPPTLDPKQIKALQSLDIPTKKNPCSAPPSIHHAIKCDNSKPFSNVISLHLMNCSDDVSLSSTALKSLSNLKDLQFINCPVSPASFPSELTSNLKSFTSINSLKKVTGVWLSHFGNLTDLTVTDVPIKASGPVIILGQLKKVTKVTLSNTNLTGELPAKSWNSNVSHIDLSDNRIEGKIPSLITDLESLISLNLSSNQLNGEIPNSIGDLIELKTLSLSSNTLSGPIPKSINSLPSLVYLDLSSNQFNGSIPKFLGEMKSLKYLNLEKNNFQGVMPFNASFIKKLEVFKIGDNTNLCYNHTRISSKMKLGIAKCDKDGFPVVAPAPKEDSDDYDGEDGSSEDSTAQKSGGSRGPNKVVLGVAIALSSIVFLIIFLILLSRKCA